ncbi:hypothetical protein [uncultured Acetobacteroides sp.]|uniref:hypothetical protein n=1 Tax=uncultured Acetobacteroides sp. TaxID=1760811 RepID=UPI0029F5ABF8|nr:hypothetical protein [uncultured Acetobacteroides sp.]
MKNLKKTKFGFEDVVVLGHSNSVSQSNGVITIVSDANLNKKSTPIIQVLESNNIIVKPSLKNKLTILSKMDSIGKIIKENNSIAITRANTNRILSIINGE